MNAREQEVMHDRALDAMQDAADMCAAEQEEQRQAIARHMPHEFIRMSRDQLMMHLFDTEFGGEYFAADIAKAYSLFAVGTITADEMAYNITQTMQDAMYSQAKWEVQS